MKRSKCKSSEWRKHLMMSWPWDSSPSTQLLTLLILSTLVNTGHFVRSLLLLVVVVDNSSISTHNNSIIPGSIPVICDSYGHGTLTILNIHASSDCRPVTCKHNKISVSRFLYRPWQRFWFKCIDGGCLICAVFWWIWWVIVANMRMIIYKGVTDWGEVPKNYYYGMSINFFGRDGFLGHIHS